MKVLVTGGTGFIGTHLVRHIRALADFMDNPLENEVRTISRRRISGKKQGRGFIFYAPTGQDVTGHYDEALQHFSFDLTDRKGVQRMFSYYQPDIIFHLAANPMVKNPEGIFRDNVESTQNLLTYCPEGCRFIFASSIVIYGDGREPKPVEYDIPKPTSEYGITKIASEHLVNMFTKRGKVCGVNLRLCATVGSGLTHGVIFDFIRKLKENDKLDILGLFPGSKKPYLHVDDAIKAFMLMINKDKLKGTFNVVPDNEINIEELAKAVMDGLDLLKPINWLGEEANWVGDNRYLCASNYLIKYMGWNPSYTSFDAIRQCVKEIK